MILGQITGEPLEESNYLLHFALPVYIYEMFMNENRGAFQQFLGIILQGYE